MCLNSSVPICVQTAPMIYIPVISSRWGCMCAIASGRCPERLFHISRRTIGLIVSIWLIKQSFELFFLTNCCCKWTKKGWMNCAEADFTDKCFMLFVTCITNSELTHGTKAVVVLMEAYLCLLFCLSRTKPMMNWREGITWLHQSCRMTQVDQLLNITAATLMTGTMVYFPREKQGVKW